MKNTDGWDHCSTQKSNKKHEVKLMMEIIKKQYKPPWIIGKDSRLLVIAGFYFTNSGFFFFFLICTRSTWTQNCLSSPLLLIFWDWKSEGYSFSWQSEGFWLCKKAYKNVCCNCLALYLRKRKRYNANHDIGLPLYVLKRNS